MPFKDKELQQLSQQIINRAVRRQTVVTKPVVERLRQSIAKRAKATKVF